MPKSLSKSSTFMMAFMALLDSACGSTEVPAETIKSRLHDFRVTIVAKGLDHPWSFAFLPDGGILITERVGRLRHFKNGTLLPKPIAGVPRVVDSGQGGLLDVVLHHA